MPVLVDLQGVSARTADRSLFSGLSVTVSTGDRLGVVGINGTGKSTLLRIVAGRQQPDAGSVLRGRGATVAYLGQEPDLPDGPVRAAVGEGWEADAALDRLGVGALAGAPTSSLSGGQAKRVALAAVLARPADLLVLDEPTNHLDLPGVAWLEQQLLARSGGLVLVSHDRHLLDRVTTRMVELDRGHHHTHDGGYASYLSARAERAERAEAADATRRNLARRELAWLRRGAPARSRKPRARIEAATAIVTGRPEAAARAGALDLAFGTPRLGSKVVELRSAGFVHPGSSGPVLAEVDVDLDPHERLGVVGANGAGKSTLLDLLAVRRAPTAGSVEVGPTVVAGYYEQRGADLDPSARVRDLVAGPSRVPGSPEDLALMERFWLAGELQHAPVGTLSGGERRRLQLLLVLAERPNLLLLDEPTNDLDLDTLRVLEDYLEDWPGALVVVSHDRTFLDRVTDRVVAVEAGGRVAEVAGGLEAWVAAATAQAKPRRAASSAPRSSAQLRGLEKDMSRLGRRRDRLAAALAAAADIEEMSRLGEELAALGAELAEVEEAWLELAEAAEA